MKLWEKILIFICINVGIGYYLETSIRESWNTLVPGDSYFQDSVSALERRMQDIDVLLLGDCNVFYSLDPASIPIKANIHNFAFPGELIGSTYWKVKHYIESGKLPKLKLAFIELRRSRLASDSPLNSDIDYSRFVPLSAFWEIDTIQDKTTWLSSRISRLWGAQPILPYLPLPRITENITPLGNAFMDLVLSEEDFKRAYREEGYDQEIDQSVQRDWSYLEDDTEYRKDVKTYLGQLLSLLEKAHVKTVFVRLPWIPTYVEQSGRDRNHTNSKRAVFLTKFYQKEFPTTPFINMMTAKEPLAVADFSDTSGHFSISGTKKLGKMLFTELVDHKLVDADGNLSLLSTERIAAK